MTYRAAFRLCQAYVLLVGIVGLLIGLFGCTYPTEPVCERAYLWEPPAEHVREIVVCE